MVELLQAQIWYDKLQKAFMINYKGELVSFTELNDCLTFIGKKLLFIKNNQEFEYNHPMFV